MPGALLVVYHSRAGHTASLARTVLEGARASAPTLALEEADCFDAGPADVLRASGVILGTPARFGYMSGAMKDFLERIYYECLERTVGLPWALFVKGDTDTSGAAASVERIVTGLRWRRVLPVLEVAGEIGEEQVASAYELGGAMAAGIEAGLF